MHYRLIILILLISGYRVLNGQNPRSLSGYFQLTYQNDYFTATDYYYTQGIRLEVESPGLRFSPLSRLLPRFGNTIDQHHRFFLAQDAYTPTSIRADTILLGDRPYAGALYVGQQLVSGPKDQRWQMTAEIKIGVIGPWALAGEEQRYIHHKTGNVEPMGWQYQIANDFLLNYELQLDRAIYRSRWLEVSGGVHTRLGTYRNRLGIHAQTVFGWHEGVFSTANPGQKSKLFLFARGHFSLIGYDASLQGGLFNQSSVYVIPASELQRLLASGELGIQARLGKLKITFSHTYISPEFRNGLSHAWGKVQIQIGF